MMYGLYLSASGVLTNLYRQDVFANNLANVQTIGFKPDVPALTQRQIEHLEDDLGMKFADPLMDRLGGGVFAGPQHVDFAQGSLQPTGRPLDAALTEPGRFFAVRHTDPHTGDTSVRLTRNGNFSRNEAGELVTQAGQPVLDRADNPITIPADAEVALTRGGDVLADGEVVAQVQVAHVADPAQLRKAGQNLFAFTGRDPRTIVQEPDIRTGVVEASGADPVKTLMKMIDATKAATGNANVLRYFDTLMDRAVNTLGRVA